MLSSTSHIQPASFHFRFFEVATSKSSPENQYGYRRPLERALRSFGVRCLFVHGDAAAQRGASASLPVRVLSTVSSRNRWFSAPPDTTLAASVNTSTIALAFFATCRRGFEPGPSFFSATALPAITCISGPPCALGNTVAEFSFLYSSSSPPFVIRPPRDPLWFCGGGGDNVSVRNRSGKRLRAIRPPRAPCRQTGMRRCCQRFLTHFAQSTTPE